MVVGATAHAVTHGAFRAAHGVSLVSRIDAQTPMEHLVHEGDVGAFASLDDDGLAMVCFHVRHVLVDVVWRRDLLHGDKVRLLRELRAWHTPRFDCVLGASDALDPGERLF